MGSRTAPQQLAALSAMVRQRESRTAPQQLAALSAMVRQRDQRIGELTAKLSALQEETARERSRHAAEVHHLVQKNARLFRRASECARASALDQQAAGELRAQLVRSKSRLVEAEQLVALLKERLEEEILRDLSTAPARAETVAPAPAPAPEPHPPPVVAAAVASPDFSAPSKPKRTFRDRQSSAVITMRRPLSPLSEHSEEERATPTSALDTSRTPQQRTTPVSPPSGGSGGLIEEEAPLPKLSPPPTLPRTVPDPFFRSSPPTEAPSPPGMRTPLRTPVAPSALYTGGSTPSVNSSVGASRPTRPRRASASRTFIEPSLKSKLRRGDPYTFGHEYSPRSSTKGSPLSPETDVLSIASELEEAAAALRRADKETQRRASLASAISFSVPVGTPPLLSRPSGNKRFLVRESPPAAAPDAVAQTPAPGAPLASPSPSIKTKARTSGRKQPASARGAASSSTFIPRGLREVNQNAWSQVRLGPAQHTGRIDGYRYAVRFD
jgi:hypothetical protein